MENNKLIAEFMGSMYINEPYFASTEDRKNCIKTDFWHWSKPENGWPFDVLSGQEYSTGYMIENWAYHRSWDWLMPVVDRINDNCKSTGYIDGLEFFNIRIVGSDIKSVYKSVVEYITWYNEQPASLEIEK